MKKNKHYFLNLAIIKTVLTSIFYLFMPIFAELYFKIVGEDTRYWGYIVFASTILILANLVLLIRAWALAMDRDVRKNYLRSDD